MSQEKEELKKKYEELYQKKAYHGWDEEKLQEMIDNFGKEDEDKDDKPSKPKQETFKGIVLDPEKTYHFKLKHRQNPRTFIPREAKVWDEYSESTRAIKLSSVEESPYVDEQDPDAHLDATAIVFTDGQVKISGVEKAKIRFLLAFDGYDKKKKILPINEWVRDMYELVDSDKLNDSSVKRAEAVMDAQAVIRNAKKEDVANFMSAVYLLPVAQLSEAEIKKAAYDAAEVDPSIILNEFTDPKHQIKANIQKLFSLQLLDDSDGVIKWRDTDGVIMNYDESKVRADEALAKWVLVGESGTKEFKERMANKLK